MAKPELRDHTPCFVNRDGHLAGAFCCSLETL